MLVAKHIKNQQTPQNSVFRIIWWMYATQYVGYMISIEKEYGKYKINANSEYLWMNIL